jgi:ATP-binding cassette, subfamily A (ABC1), member 3
LLIFPTSSLGINGAGKTTTFKMLTGDENFSDGDAFVNGFSIRNQITKVYKHVSYCPQFDALLTDLTGHETMLIYSLLRGIPKNDIDAVCKTLSSEVGLVKHLDKQIKAYSGGNKRKLGIAIALIGEPDLIFLDEPTAGEFECILFHFNGF